MNTLLLVALAVPASEPYSQPQPSGASPAAASPAPGCPCCGTGQGSCCRQQACCGNRCEQPCGCEGHRGRVRAWLHGLLHHHQKSCPCCPAHDGPTESYSLDGGVTWIPGPYPGASTGTVRESLPQVPGPTDEVGVGPSPMLPRP
jgi:hypothetical protein